MNTNVVDVLQRAVENLNQEVAGSELVLDFSSVQRIDPAALRALGELAGAAHDRAAKVILDGVNVDVYKVLKLMKLEQRFSFRS